MAYGLPYTDREVLDEDWAHFPDKAVRGYWADVIWNGNLVNRELVLSVDGGRALLPAPQPILGPESPDGDVTVAGYSVTSMERDFARVVHSFEHQPSEFDSYFGRAGFEVRDAD